MAFLFGRLRVLQFLHLFGIDLGRLEKRVREPLTIISQKCPNYSPHPTTWMMEHLLQEVERMVQGGHSTWRAGKSGSGIQIVCAKQ